MFRKVLVMLAVGLCLIAVLTAATSAQQAQKWEYLRIQWASNLEIGVPLTGDIESNKGLAETMIMMTSEHEDDDGSLLMIELDYLGDMGWELVSVTPVNEYISLFDFKRPK